MRIFDAGAALVEVGHQMVSDSDGYDVAIAPSGSCMAALKRQHPKDADGRPPGYRTEADVLENAL